MRVDYELESVYMDVSEKVNLGREFCSECGKYCYSEREAGHIINLNKRHHCNDHLGKVKKIPKKKILVLFLRSVSFNKYALL